VKRESHGIREGYFIPEGEMTSVFGSGKKQWLETGAREMLIFLISVEWHIFRNYTLVAFTAEVFESSEIKPGVRSNLGPGNRLSVCQRLHSSTHL
jgi:hypothetical protein